MHREPAVSHVVSTIFLVVIVVGIIAVILAFLLGFLTALTPASRLAPPLIQVTSVIHTTASGTMKDASRVFIQNKDSTEFKNRDLMAEFYKGREKLYARIFTLHGADFIPSHHFGVSTMGGAGCSNDYFSPGEMIEINLKDGYYAPGDLVELRIYQRSSDISNIQLTGNVGDDKYMQEWLKENYYSDHKGYRIISQHQFRA